MDEPELSQVTLWERKQPDSDHEGLKTDFTNFRKELMAAVNSFVQKQITIIMNKISEDVYKGRNRKIAKNYQRTSFRTNKIKSDIADLKHANNTNERNEYEAYLPRN